MHNCTQQSFLLYLASLRETPRDGGRDEEIRLNRIWLETRHTPQTLFLYRANRLAFRYRRHLPCSLGREIEPATTTTAVVYTQPRENTEAHPWTKTEGTLFVRSFVIRPDFSRREKAEWKAAFGRFSTFRGARSR